MNRLPSTPAAATRRRALSRPARSALLLGLALGIALGAGGLALGDIATSSSGVPSGTVLTCAGTGGALRYVVRGSCKRRERKLVLADSAPLIATLTTGTGSVVASPGLLLEGTSMKGEFDLQLSPKVVRDVRRCAYIATPSVTPENGHITRQVDVVAAPLDAHEVIFREFDSSGAVASDGISVEIYCP